MHARVSNNAPFRVRDHVDGRAVLHRAAVRFVMWWVFRLVSLWDSTKPHFRENGPGVEVLSLAEDAAACGLRQGLELQERRVAHHAQEAVDDLLVCVRVPMQPISQSIHESITPSWTRRVDPTHLILLPTDAPGPVAVPAAGRACRTLGHPLRTRTGRLIAQPSAALIEEE